jgi:MFS family permease
LIFVAGWFLIRRDDHSELAGARMDIGGAVTVTLAMVTAVYAIVTFGESGVTTPASVSALLAIALIATFLAIQRRVAAPLLPLPLLRHGLLASVSVAGLLFMGAFAAFQFAITLYLQELRGWTPLETGLTFAIMGADMAIAPLLTPRLVARFGNVSVMLAGLATAVVAYTLALGLDASWTYWDFLPTLLLIAVSFAFVYGPLASAATESLAESGHGVAGGVVYTGFQFGVALGVSAVTVLLVGTGDHVEAASSGDYTRSLVVPLVAAALAVAAGLVARGRQRSVGVTASPELISAAGVG